MSADGLIDVSNSPFFPGRAYPINRQPVRSRTSAAAASKASETSGDRSERRYS